MIDVYEIREGHFEIIDSEMHQQRSRRKLYQVINTTILVILVIGFFMVLVLSYVTSSLLWLAAGILPLFIGYLGYRNVKSLNKQLNPQISSILLNFNQSKELEDFSIRRWRQGKIDEFEEEKIRYNQAVGFRVIWHENGYLVIEIIVDPNFPGSEIFETYDFFVVAELKLIFEKALPNLDRWIYQLEDGSEWSEEAQQEHYEDQQTARVPWLIREYFDEL